MKLLFYISTIRGGGAGRVLINLANYMVSTGHNVCFVTNFPSEEDYCLDDRVDRRNVEKFEGEYKKINQNPVRIFALRKIMKEVNPDVCLSFMGENNVRLLLANILLKKKCIVSVRNDPNKEYCSLPLRILAKILYCKADGIVFQTEDAKSWFSHKIQGKSQIIMNAVDERFFKINLDENRMNIVAVGRLSGQKNFMMLIRAYSRIAGLIQDDLLIYGEGSLHDEIQEKIDEYGLHDRIHLMGTTADVPGVLKKAKAFVMSSDYEGMPNALMEALAVGVPSISTDCPCGGPRMLIKNGYNGILVPVGDSDKLAEAMKRILENAALANEFSKNAKNGANEFRSDKIFKCWQKYIEGIMNT
ncbi:glycosyltransferase family 4 protein [Holdemania massiliensis]|uniref:glycosyltransferase family 4 protein n=1 Tax=Holdemania massiliensis TaxID=1468449 RepID=UPI001F06B4CA|nr:glycosyltransferase family 4 protein [Holdemania massiliensis]MCH1940703.1 glycosyltransferase family 4 protein [Holdemania massiliensis]